MKTRILKGAEINRKWHLIDANGQVLGRLAVKIADLLSGKSKVSYTPNIDDGDYVVVVNCAKFSVTGKKLERKKYYRYTGYPGGLRTEAMGVLKQRRPDELIRKAVSGMLHHNHLHDRRLARLLIYKSGEHPHAVQLGEKNAQ
jgi:large subunit ribosomal protein L13